MFRGQREILEQTVAPVMDYFDGLIAVIDDKASLSTTDWLHTIKKGGEIVVQQWVNDHAWTMNRFLLSNKLNYGDWIVIIDETDKLNIDFLKKLREYCDQCSDCSIGAVYIDHPFILLYHDGLRVFGSPHWGVTGVLGNSINLTQEPGYKKENYIDNLRKNDILRSAFLSPIKYWFCYPAYSNHTQLLYRQFGEDKWQQHENIRVQFRICCSVLLKIPLTLDGLEKYLIDNVGHYDPTFEQTLELEVNLKDAFRLFVLKQPWKELAANRFNWSYVHWKKTGEIIQNPKLTGYVGVFNKYKLAKGETPE